ncbi:prostate stem cell antigen-like [Anguilla rostrata]|uniref:prostate stem cell antigen-like n=1 Tax=Anguilla rostrata TaxID=7938 RepID=UPI0030CD2CB5
MKTGLTFLLVISSFCFAADALQCYSCTSSSSNAQCNQNTVNCTGLSDTCMTTVTQVVGIQSITKTCSTASTCNAAAAANINLVIGANTVTCCQTNLCNVNGFEMIRLNVLLLALPAAMMALSFGTS